MRGYEKLSVSVDMCENVGDYFVVIGWNGDYGLRFLFIRFNRSFGLEKLWKVKF